jgi:hypothetical protein
MKVLLAASLILNVVLGVLYYQEKSQPPIERIIMEHKVERVQSQAEPVQMKKAPHPQGAMMVNTSDANTDEDQIIVQDEQTFIQASEELTRAQNDYFLLELELTDDILKKKVKLTNNFYQQTGSLYKKNLIAGRMSFQDRRKEIALEEKLHQDYAKLLGSKKWEQYKKFVDDYNQKILKNHKSREISPLMMGY